MKKNHKLYIFFSVGVFVTIVFVCTILFIQKNEFTGDNSSQKKMIEEQKNDTVDIIKNQKETVIIKSGEKLIYGKEQWKNFLDNTNQEQESHIMLYFPAPTAQNCCGSISPFYRIRQAPAPVSGVPPQYVPVHRQTPFPQQALLLPDNPYRFHR